MLATEIDQLIHVNNNILLKTIMASPMGIVMMREDNSVVLANKKACRSLRLSLKKILNINSEDLARHVAEKFMPATEYLVINKDKVNIDFNTVLYSSEPTEKVCYLKSNYTEINKSLLSVTKTIVNSDIVAAILFVQELSQDEDITNALSDFLAKGAHELRTPMASIFGFAELLRTRDFDEDQKKQIYKQLYEQSVYISELIEAFFDLAKLEQNEAEQLDLKKTDIEELLRNIVSTYPIRKDANPIELSCNLKEQTKLCIDKNLIKRAIYNILDNSYKYSGQDVNVKVSLIKKEINNAELISIIIQDDGVGMSDIDLQNITKKFWRGQNRSLNRGAGLGMSYVAKTTEAHNAELHIESEVEKGTTVELLFYI